MTVDIERALLRRAIRAAGGYARFAAGLGISRQTIYRWKRVPERWISQIERVSGIPRHELRPDLYREPLTVVIERDAAETDLWFEARYKKRGSVAPIIASRSYRRGPVNGLQDQSTFLRITSWSPSTPVLAWLLVSPAANPTDARYAGISR